MNVKFSFWGVVKNNELMENMSQVMSGEYKYDPKNGARTVIEDY